MTIIKIHTVGCIFSKTHHSGTRTNDSVSYLTRITPVIPYYTVIWYVSAVISYRWINRE